MKTRLPKLVLVTDRKLNNKPLAVLCREAIEGGVDTIQLREKDLEEGALLDYANRLREITSALDAMLIINHAIDVAMAADANGVHLGWRSLLVPDARRLIGPDKLVGVSVHDQEEALQAERDGADYVQFGPIFATRSKEGLVPPRGTSSIRNLKQKLKIPIIVVGGIKVENVPDVTEAGADGVAVISAIMAADDPRDAAGRLKKAMEGAYKK